MGRFMARVAFHSALAICAIIALSNVWPAETARGADLAQPAQRHPALKSGHRAQRHSDGIANAGRPVVMDQQGAATGAAPTASELDERERMMTSRPEAGPALRETAPDASSTKQPLPGTTPPTEPTQQK